MMLEPIDTENFSGWYDDEIQVLRVAYKGVLSPDVTAQMYRWLGEVIQRRPADVVRAKGSIYDFRQVTGFDSRNLTSAQRQSQQFNTKVDMTNHPVALLVDTFLQEQILRVELKISPQQDRKRMVHSEAEALAFIASFHPVENETK
ncbi:MAG: hypothetical protein ABI690_18210 [Chloroflexota bacterium]